LDKELLTAVLTYNLVRAIMCLAARKAGLHLRQLSFTYAYNLVADGIRDVLAASTFQTQSHAIERLIDFVARCRLPNRRTRRSYARKVWGRGRAFPSKREEK